MVKKRTTRMTEREIKSDKREEFQVRGATGLWCRKYTSTPNYFFRWMKNGEKFILWYGAISLKDAFRLATEDRELVKLGGNPKEERAKERATIAQQEEREREQRYTLRVVADRFHKEGQACGLWNGKDKGEHEIKRFNTGILPSIGDRPIKDITAQELKTFFVEKGWTTRPNQCRKLQQRLCQIFNWAIATNDYGITNNPADIRGPLGVLLKPLTKMQKPNGNMPAPHYSRIPELIKEILNCDSSSSKALVMQILTATRPEAILHMRWSDIDFKNQVWKVPPEYDKGSKEFGSSNRPREVYLSSQVLDLLQRIPKLHKCEWVFPSRNGYGKPLGDCALAQCLKGVHGKKKALDGIGWVDETTTNRNDEPRYIVPHGTARATFRTWAEETHQHDDAAELCLLHLKKDIYGGAYRRGLFKKERQDIMQKWGNFCFQGINLDDYLPKLE